MAADSERADVLIVGAGPTGLVLALWLTRLGVRVRIVDRAAEPSVASRALAVHARTLELYRQLGLADAVIERGHRVSAVNLWLGGARRARVSLADVGTGRTRYPFVLMLPQDEHERLLIARLQALGVTVERQVELVGYSETGEGIVAQLRGPSGEAMRCAAAYVAGCDGARSVVRESMGVGFPGGTYEQLFYVADVEASGPAVNGEVNIDLNEADFLAVFPLASVARVRLTGTVRDDRAALEDTLSFADISDRAMKDLRLDVRKVNWFSTYRVHHRVAAHFRRGRGFLLGDAAHIHTPVGGQGMNTGIGDATNLAWKLQMVLAGRAPDSLLDTYETERSAFARRLVRTTDRVFIVASGTSAMADLLRTRIVPLVVPAVARLGAARAWLFQTVSQLIISYRHSPLSGGQAGAVRGGDRLPWAALGDADNHSPLARITWQVHVYGEARPVLTAWCAAHEVPLNVFAWREAYARAGLVRDASYLLRPDTYVALVDPAGSSDALARYFADRQMVV